VIFSPPHPLQESISSFPNPAFAEISEVSGYFESPTTTQYIGESNTKSLFSLLPRFLKSPLPLDSVSLPSLLRFNSEEEGLPLPSVGPDDLFFYSSFLSTLRRVAVYPHSFLRQGVTYRTLGQIFVATFPPFL